MTLTPLAKGLISVLILGAAGFGVWNVIGKGDPVGGDPNEEEPSSSWTLRKKSAQAPLGSESNPVRVSIVTFTGYAPLLVANGDSLETQAGSIYAEQGLSVKALLQDDVPSLASLFEGDVAHCAWRTSDAVPLELANLQNAKHDARVVMAVDNTRGADAIVTTDESVRSVEDLAGQEVALLQYTPSHSLMTYALDNSALTAKQRASVRPVFINIEEGTAGVRAALASGAVKSAVLWDPDLSLAVKAGARVVYDTRTASDLIHDVILCDKRVLDKPENEQAIQKFVAGWLEGSKVVEADPSRGSRALVASEPAFKLLADEQGEDFVTSLFSKLDLMSLADNIRLFGMGGNAGTPLFNQVFKTFDEVYRNLGALANPSSPVIDPAAAVDYRFLETLMGEDAASKTAAAAPRHAFVPDGVNLTDRAALSKPVEINFATGSAELGKRSQKTIDEAVVPLLDLNGAAYIIVSGHTDATGSAKGNQRLSEARAQAVVEYLVREWEYPKERFQAVGYGSTRPACDEASPELLGLSEEECRAMNRATRVSVVSR